MLQVDTSCFKLAHNLGRPVRTQLVDGLSQTSQNLWDFYVGINVYFYSVLTVSNQSLWMFASHDSKVTGSEISASQMSRQPSTRLVDRTLICFSGEVGRYSSWICFQTFQYEFDLKGNLSNNYYFAKLQLRGTLLIVIKTRRSWAISHDKCVSTRLIKKWIAKY